MASASIYYSNVIRKDGFTQTQIANASGVTAVTIRNRVREIKKKIQIQKDEHGKNLIISATCNKSNSSLEKI